VGTTSIDAKLNVAGTIGVGTTTAKIRRNQVSGSTGLFIQGNANDTVSDTNPGAYIGIGGGPLTDGYEGNISIVAYGATTDNNRNQITFSNRSGTNTVTERARIDSSGNLLVGDPNGTQRFVASKDASGSYVARFSNTTGSNANGVYIDTPNRAGDGGLFGLTVANSGGNAFAIYTNGTYGTISDINRKKNVETARNGYLTDLCALRVVKYNWKEQEDSAPKELGFIAQEIEQVFSGLVQTDDNGQKMVKQPVLIPMLIKAIQELKAEFDAYKASHP
jgi:hypothetical protein